MPLDHYVSQVHLRKFYSPKLNNLMYAIRKSDLKEFCCNSQSVCRIEDGSSNAYLRKDRLVEDFLQHVEPKYSTSLSKLCNGAIDQECIFALAGFAAYIMSCSPASMRVFSDPLKAYVETTAKILDRSGDLPPAPDVLAGKSLTELLEEGTVHCKIDPKFPQAIGITSIIGWVSVFGNSHWEILRIDEPDASFFTSDFPVGIERSIDPRVLNKIVPLAPDLAIRIYPDIRLTGEKPDLSFRRFTAKQRVLRRQEIIEINRCLVRCAEDMVFFRDNLDWIVPFIARNRHYRIEGVTQRIPNGTGFLHVSTQRIVSTR